MGNGFRLLVVEDDAVLCESIADILRFAGYEVATAEDGEAALRLLCEAPQPDAILLDLILPRMTSDRLLDTLDARLRPRPPVVLMTGMVPSPASLPTMDEVLLKPFDVDELLERMAHACCAGRARAQAPSATREASPSAAPPA
jgi:two-component system, OmpR family, response regulator MprA